jgi:hypothetical protein
VTIQAQGVTVGLINGWAPTQGRTVTPIFQVMEDNSGNPEELMPGNITGLSITVTRYDIYKTRMEEAFGTVDLVMLTRQNTPFDVIEAWQLPGSKEGKERFLYSGCWFTSLGRTLSSNDARIVNVNATLMYTKKLRVSGMGQGLTLSGFGT